MMMSSRLPYWDIPTSEIEASLKAFNTTVRKSDMKNLAGKTHDEPIGVNLVDLTCAVWMNQLVGEKNADHADNAREIDIWQR